MRIAVALFDDAEELDWAGPWEVLAFWARMCPDDGVEVVTVAADAGPVSVPTDCGCWPTSRGTSSGPSTCSCTPGGPGTRDQLADEDVRRRLRETAAAGALMTSVCTGSLVYAAAGLLDGRAATTHWADVDELASHGQDVEVRTDDRVVDTGEVITAAGVSAGIDVALHLVARLHSPERARQVRRGIQYDPAPPV